MNSLKLQIIKPGKVNRHLLSYKIYSKDKKSRLEKHQSSQCVKISARKLPESKQRTDMKISIHDQECKCRY